MQIFISHSSIDAETAGKICDFLEKNGMKCFIAPRDIRSGKAYAEEIIDGIDRSTAMILLMSQNATALPTYCERWNGRSANPYRSWYIKWKK